MNYDYKSHEKDQGSIACSYIGDRVHNAVGIRIKMFYMVKQLPNHLKKKKKAKVSQLVVMMGST